jgi:hypothetical protein
MRAKLLAAKAEAAGSGAESGLLERLGEWRVVDTAAIRALDGQFAEGASADGAR